VLEAANATFDIRIGSLWSCWNWVYGPTRLRARHRLASVWSTATNVMPFQMVPASPLDRLSCLLLQKAESTLQPGKHLFDGRDNPSLIALGEID
jgi:hypothetical protein